MSALDLVRAISSGVFVLVACFTIYALYTAYGVLHRTLTVRLAIVLGAAACYLVVLAMVICSWKVGLKIVENGRAAI